MPREPTKCKNWEKERRERLNEAFSTLCKLLPCYDPAINTSKIDILRHASTYIEELREKIKELISTNDENAAKAVGEGEIQRLHDRIKRLLSKNEQLCCLLRVAKITIPPGCAVIRKLKRAPNWTSRIAPNVVKKSPKKEVEKENDSSINTSQARKFSNKSKPNARASNNTPKHRKAILNRPDSKTLKSAKKKRTSKSLSPSKCVIVLSQPSMSQSCYVITNAPSSNILGNAPTVITNSGMLTNPLVSSTAKTSKALTAVSPLGPGTLILANGTIMPILPQQTVLPMASQIISNSIRPSNPTVIILPRNPQRLENNPIQRCNKIPVTTTNGKSLARIKPKYCLTRTTQVNKVPIPALTSRYANNDLICAKNEVKTKNKNSEKKASNKDLEKKPDKTPEVGEKRKLPQNEQCDDAKKSKLDGSNPLKDSAVKETAEKSPETKPTSSTKEKPEETNLNLINSKKPEKIADKSPNQIVPTINKDNSAKDVAILEAQSQTNHIVESTPPTKSSMEKKPDAPPPQAEDIKALELNINHSELSNDIFASLQVPTGCQNPESTSPTAAFLMAFPLVSSLTGVKVTEVTEEDNPESQRGTPTLLQIGTMDSTKPTQSESLTPNLLNLDNLSFFTSKDICGSFYNAFDGNLTTTTSSSIVPPLSVKTTIKNDVLNAPTNELIQSKIVPKIQYPLQKSDLSSCFANNSTMIPNNHQQQPIVNNYQVKNKPSGGKGIEAKPACANYVPQKNNFNAQCNNFNDLSKVSTCSYSIKSYPDPLYTNSNTYSYSYPDGNFNQNYYKNITKNDNNRSFYSLNYENYSDYRKNDANAAFSSSTTNYSYTNTQKFVNNPKAKVAQSRAPINWMTTPDNRLQAPADYVLPQFSKESDFNAIYPTNSFTNTQTTYFNSNTVFNDVGTNQDTRKSLELPLVPPVNSYQRNDVEENQFSWSPTKMPQFLDPPHGFVTSTLPTLVGDLALGNPLTFADQKTEPVKNCQKKEARRLKNYENNPSNFLSVSQLVDHNKPEPARTVSRRNSGNRNKKAPQKTNQRTKEKDLGSYNNNKVDGKVNQLKQQISYNNNNVQNSHDMFCDGVVKSRNVSKNTSTNYSAEALIGQMQSSEMSQKNRQQNFSNKALSVPSFLPPENIIPYFPPVDLPQDNNYMQQNQNYQSTSFGHNFSTTFQNNTYTPNTFIPTATTITSTYLSTNNFMHDMGVTSHDYSDNLNLFATTAPKEKSCGKNVNRREQQQAATCTVPPPNVAKKAKRKHSSNETNLPNFVDFPFLSMPGAINSPILPDDFHTHSGFLQPPTPQLYQCKNPLYSKQNDLASSSLLPLPPVPGTRSSIQHPEISPSINSAGTSLTNFNLSTIFPEINNKNGLADPYQEPRIKEHSSSRSYSSTVQVPFNDKPTFTF